MLILEKICNLFVRTNETVRYIRVSVERGSTVADLASETSSGLAIIRILFSLMFLWKTDDALNRKKIFLCGAIKACSPLRKQEKSKSTFLGGSASYKGMGNVEKILLCSFASHLGNSNRLNPLLPVVVKLGNVTRGLLKRHMSNYLRTSSFCTEIKSQECNCILNLLGRFGLFSLVFCVCSS